MNEILAVAEEEMLDMKHLYVNTGHFVLAYIKLNLNNEVNYEDMREYFLSKMGSAYKESEYVLYTPLLRKYIATDYDVKEVMKHILSDDSCIAYNILNNMGVDIEKMLNDF